MTRNRICPCEVNIIRASENRADIVKFRDILKGATDLSESHEKQFEEILEISDGVDHARMRLAWTKEKANVLFGLEQYQEAIVLYKNATKFVLGEDTKFLALEAYNEGYKKALASMPHINIYLDLIFCFNRISEAYLQIQDRTNALYWLQDLEALYEYQGRFTSSNTNGKVEKFLELCTYRMEAAHRFVRIFHQGNP